MDSPGANQPVNKTKIDPEAFKAIRKMARIQSLALRGNKRTAGFATPLPQIVGLKLTNRCTLRCKHCYEWNQDGYHWNLDAQDRSADLDIEIAERVLTETSDSSSTIYLWGGEPLIYRDFERLTDLLANDPRTVAICTNGGNLERQLPNLLKLKNVEVLLALDGFETECDAIRGKGTFRCVERCIRLLSDLRKRGTFQGTLSVHCLISDAMTDKLFDFANWIDSIGVDSLLLCFPWFLSNRTSREMDDFYEKNFAWLRLLANPDSASWKAFKYSLDPSKVRTILQQMHLIRERPWKTRVRFQPSLSAHEVIGFVTGQHRPPPQRKCLSVACRLDVLPDASVTSCKHFPEFRLGNLKSSTVAEIWHSDAFHRVRETVGKGLMPICAVCNNLYLHGFESSTKAPPPPSLSANEPILSAFGPRSPNA